MKRALVALGHPEHAGMVRALGLLAGAAPEHGWELDFVFAGPSPLAGASGLSPDRITYLPALRGSRRWSARLGMPVTAVNLARRARGADLLYACTLSSFPCCLWAGRLARLPQVVHVYSSYADAAPYRKHRLARARHVVAPSADSLALAARAVGGFPAPTRTHVVYNGMDIEWIRSQAAGPAPAVLDATNGPCVGMVGNLDARKNPALLLEAAARVRARIPGLRVVLVGGFPDPAYEAHIRARIETLGLTDTVVVTGFLPNPFPAVQRLAIVAHPARRDPFPLALLEAMALDRPIVATAVGGIPEMLVDGESGLLVPPDDPEALAGALASLLTDPDRRLRLGASAGLRLATRFSRARFAAGMFAAFDQAVVDAHP